jgi:hypothetical protein
MAKRLVFANWENVGAVTTIIYTAEQQQKTTIKGFVMNMKPGMGASGGEMTVLGIHEESQESVNSGSLHGQPALWVNFYNPLDYMQHTQAHYGLDLPLSPGQRLFCCSYSGDVLCGGTVILEVEDLPQDDLGGQAATQAAPCDFIGRLTGRC